MMVTQKEIRALESWSGRNQKSGSGSKEENTTGSMDHGATCDVRWGEMVLDGLSLEFGGKPAEQEVDIVDDIDGAT
jgi:hypothetical protein